MTSRIGDPVHAIRTLLATTLFTGAAVLGLTAVPGSVVANAASPASVYVIQGVDATSWTLSVDGEEVADQAPAKQIVGPLDLAPGKHSVSAVDESGTKVQASMTIQAGESLDVVLHRPVDPTADPIFTTFTNDLAAVAAKSGRLTVAHTAVAPPADIRVDGDVLLANVASAEQISTTVPAGTYPVDVVPTATDGPSVLGPVDLAVEAGALTRVFAIGNANEQTMDAVVQVIKLPTSDSAVPSDVPAGDGGQGEGLLAADGASTSLLAGLTLAVAGGLLVAAGRRRRVLSRV